MYEGSLSKLFIGVPRKAKSYPTPQAYSPLVLDAQHDSTR
jgi:hypothetical protein